MQPRSILRSSAQWYKHTLFEGLTFNTSGYVTSCLVFFIRAMSKISVRIIVHTQQTIKYGKYCSTIISFSNILASGFEQLSTAFLEPVTDRI